MYKIRYFIEITPIPLFFVISVLFPHYSWLLDPVDNNFLNARIYCMGETPFQ